MEYHRSTKQTMAGVALLLGVSVLAAVTLDYALRLGGVLFWILTVVLAAWSVFKAWDLINRRVFMRLERHGCWIATSLGRVSFDFEDLIWANLEQGQRICFFAYQKPGDAKPRYTGISQRVIGPEAVEIIRQHVYRVRPDLPTSDPASPQADKLQADKPRPETSEPHKTGA